MDKVRAVIVERSSAVYSWKLGQDIEACENHNAGSRKHVNSQQPTLSTRLHELHPNAFLKITSVQPASVRTHNRVD